MEAKMERCRDCCYLIEGDEGEWICDIYNAAVIYIEDDDCPAETDSFWIP